MKTPERKKHPGGKRNTNPTNAIGGIGPTKTTLRAKAAASDRSKTYGSHGKGNILNGTRRVKKTGWLTGGGF